MYIKLKGDDKVIGDVYCCDGFTEEVDERYTEDIKEKVKEGYDVYIRDDQEWVHGEKYFGLEEVDYEELLDIHWKKRVDQVKDYTDNYKEVQNILEYAQENDQPDSVLGGLEEYLEELEE